MGNANKKPGPALKFGRDGLVRNHDLRRTRIENVNLEGGVIDDITFEGGEISNSNLNNVTLANCEIDGLRINGVEIAPLLRAAKRENDTFDPCGDDPDAFDGWQPKPKS